MAGQTSYFFGSEAGVKANDLTLISSATNIVLDCGSVAVCEATSSSPTSISRYFGNSSGFKLSCVRVLIHI